MTVSAPSPPATAPPDDPVHAALRDPGTTSRLFGHLLAKLRHHHDAEDALQDVCIRASKSAAKFDPTRNVSAWLHGFAVNVIREKRRERQRHRGEEVHEWTAVAPDDNRAELADRLADLVRHLDSLPDGYREVIRLRHLDNLSYDDIAERMTLTPQNVRQRVRRGLLLLGERVQSEKGVQS